MIILLLKCNKTNKYSKLKILKILFHKLKNKRPLKNIEIKIFYSLLTHISI
jgi:hypothetical protein